MVILYQLAPEFTSLIWLIWVAFIMLMIFYPQLGQRFQLEAILRDIGRKLERIRIYRDEVRNKTVETVKNVGKPSFDPSQEIDKLMDFFMIPPESMDPFGIVYKLEHIINIGEGELESQVREMSPQAEDYQVKTLSNLVDVSRGMNMLYRIVRHFYLLGRKTRNIYLVAQLQMLMPQIMEIAEAFRHAANAFSKGQPIGDGVGVLAAAKFVKGAGRVNATYEVAKDTIVTEVEHDSRRVLVVRAAGPGGSVGRPGEGVKKLIESNGDAVKLIITIDAALKLEGDESGKVAEGIGVAIGGPGVDKFKIEEVAKSKGIPVYAIVIYQSIAEAITPMREVIAKAADKVADRIKKIISEKVSQGATVILAGIGNTVGIG